MTPIRNSKGKLIGLTEKVGHQKQIRLPGGHLLGWYDSNTDQTRKSNGQLVGTGDQTSSLL